MIFQNDINSQIFSQKLIIRCFPKHIRSTESPHEQFAQVMNVIRRYDRESKAEFRPSGEYGHMEFSLLSEALSMLDDYAEHGIYSNVIHESELNGGGEILWDKTIGSIDPFFSNDTPFYMELGIDDEQSYVTRLHKHLLTECSQLLERTDLLELFGIVPLYLNDDPREHFGSDTYIVHDFGRNSTYNSTARSRSFFAGLSDLSNAETACPPIPCIFMARQLSRPCGRPYAQRVLAIC